MFYIAFFLFITATLFSPIKIKINVRVERGKEPLLSMFIFRYRILSLVLNQESMSLKMPAEAIKAVRISGLPTLTVVKEIKLNVKMGTGNNVFFNAICVGLLKSVLGCVSGLTMHENIEKTGINVSPVYGENVFFINFCGIIELSVADVLISIITLFAKTVVPSERGEK